MQTGICHRGPAVTSCLEPGAAYWLGTALPGIWKPRAGTCAAGREGDPAASYLHIEDALGSYFAARIFRQSGAGSARNRIVLRSHLLWARPSGTV
jgi:hypothetical protein